MRLLIAWAVSALAGFVAFVVMTLIGAAISTLYASGHPLTGYTVTIPYAHAIAFFLVVQFTYGGLVYLVLSWLGLFNLPLVLLVYLAPIGGLFLMPTDAPGNFTNVIPTLAGVATLAVVGWRLARSPATCPTSAPVRQI